MPIKHAALKQIRKDRKRRPRNQAVRSELKTMTKRLVTLLTAQQLDEAKTLLYRIAKRYDQAASKGIIHPNTASRHKSRLMHRLNQHPSSSPV